jgi:hypothetical protein
MAKRPTAKMIAEGLTVPERIMLFCIAFVPLWQRAPLAPSLTRELFVRGLIDREGTNSYTLTDQGRAVLAASFDRRIIAAPSKSSRRKCKSAMATTLLRGKRGIRRHPLEWAEW